MLRQHFSRLITLAALVYTLVAVGNATQVMRRPDSYQTLAHFDAEEYSQQKTIIRPMATGKVQAAYFTNWYEVMLPDSFQPIAHVCV